jgi:hypothetical protein
MVKAKHEGVGRGVGGGRPRREGTERVGVKLSKEAVKRLRDLSVDSGEPQWRVLDGMILGYGLTPEALAIAQTVSTWLAINPDYPDAVESIHEAVKAHLRGMGGHGAEYVRRPSWMLNSSETPQNTNMMTLYAMKPNPMP